MKTWKQTLRAHAAANTPVLLFFTACVVNRQRHQLPEKEEDCPVFIDKDGNVKEVGFISVASLLQFTACRMTNSPDKGALQAMCCDYGFRSGFGRLYQGGDGEIPKNLFELV